MSPIESIFFYRSFLCLTRCNGEWVIFCTTYFYGYAGRADPACTAAKEKVDYLFKLRYEKAEREQT